MPPWLTRRKHGAIFAVCLRNRRTGLILGLKARAGTWSGTSATASTTLRRCTPRTSAFPVMNGVDVAKDAAKIILLEKDLAVLNEGVLEGARGATPNIMKYIIMSTSSNFGNMFSIGRGVAVPEVPAHVADSDPAEQLSLRHFAGRRSGR